MAQTLDETLKLAKDNDGEYYVARDKTDVHDEQVAAIKAWVKELVGEDETTDQIPHWCTARNNLRRELRTKIDDAS